MVAVLPGFQKSWSRMLGNLVTVRPVDINDSTLVYKWRNDERVREYMFNSDPIDQTNHDYWMKKSIIDPFRYLLLVCKENKPFGFAQFNAKPCKTVADWGFYVDPDGAKRQGRTLGHYILNYAFLEIGLRRVYAEVLESNRRSIALHTRLGFSCEGILREHHKHNNVYQNVRQYGLLASEWSHQNTQVRSHDK